MRKHSVGLPKPKGRALKHNPKENHQATQGKTERKEQRKNTKSTRKQDLNWH